ncbi:tRNA threonylcarbamoyladenosine dehydratase, partial [Xanthomonas perforans]
ATHITGTFAFVAVGKALEMLLKPKPKAAAPAAEAVAAS